MPVLKCNKEIFPEAVSSGGCFDIKISLCAAPSCIGEASDIILIADRSCSMHGKAMRELKKAALNFINASCEAVPEIRTAIISFDREAVIDVPFTCDRKKLTSAVETLSAGNCTNHEAAFIKAYELMKSCRCRNVKIIMFTDGIKTAGRDALYAAEKLKAEGAEIFCAALKSNSGINIKELEKWASSPEHVFCAACSDEIYKVFDDIYNCITLPGAEDIIIKDTVNKNFFIEKIVSASKGEAQIFSENKAVWKIPVLGKCRKECACLILRVRHKGEVCGKFSVNESISYHDKSGCPVSFPLPIIDVICPECYCPEPCPEGKEVTMKPCEDFKVFDAGEIFLSSPGRILRVEGVIKAVCPGKELAAAIMLTEYDSRGLEHSRGLKTFTVPAHHGKICRDICIKGVDFILPGYKPDCSECNSLCEERRFYVRMWAHYTENGNLCKCYTKNYLCNFTSCDP